MCRRRAGVGIFHSGVEVYGVEWAYGAKTCQHACVPPTVCDFVCGGAAGTGSEVHICGAGGHEYDVSGIFATNPGDAPGPGTASGAGSSGALDCEPYSAYVWQRCQTDNAEVPRTAVTFRERLVIGQTSLTPQGVQDAVQEMGDVYKGNAYHLLQRCVDQYDLLHACGSTWWVCSVHADACLDAVGCMLDFLCKHAHAGTAIPSATTSVSGSLAKRPPLGCA
jgi:PPPDE putative peptidase domain